MRSDSILYVYPKMLAPGTAVVVQTKLPRTDQATQCLSVIAPDGLESEVSCGVVEMRRVIFTPVSAGLHTVRLEIFVNDRPLARRDETFCVVGGDEDCYAPAAPPPIPE